MPLVTPALSALAIFTFLGNWTAFFWPLIVTTSAELYTLPVGLSSFAVEQSIQWEMIMTGASIATLPDAHRLPPPPALHRPRRHAGRTQRLKPMNCRPRSTTRPSFPIRSTRKQCCARSSTGPRIIMSKGSG